MSLWYKTLLILGLMSGLQSCNMVDDYMLGKDNTPAPAPLEKIKPEFSLSEKWRSSVSVAKKGDPFLKIKPVAVGDKLYTASNAGIIQAVSKQDGKVIWSQQLPTGIVSGPTVGIGLIIVSTDKSSVVALNENTGKVMWQHQVSGDVLSKPVIYRDKIIVKTIDGNVYALSFSTGEKLWLAAHGSPHIILKASSSPVLMHDNVLLVGFSDGKLDAIDANTGNVMWSRAMAYAMGSSDVERLVDIDSDPIIEGNTVYLAGYQGSIGALSLQDGNFIWKKPASTFKNITIKGNALYMTDSNDVVWSYDKNTGQVLWKQEDLKARGLTEPVMWGNRVVLGDKFGYIHVLAADNGKIMTRAEVPGPVIQAPVLSSNTLYVQSANGQLIRLAVG